MRGRSAGGADSWTRQQVSGNTREAEMEFMMAMNEYKTKQREDVSDLERGARGVAGPGVREGSAEGKLREVQPESSGGEPAR